MTVCRWRAPVPVLAPLRWLPRSIRRWRSSPVIVTLARRSRRSAIPATIHGTVVVTIAAVVRPLRVPLIRTHANSATCWSRRQVVLLFLAPTAGVQFVTILIPWEILGSSW